jgi:DNA modification methylase
MQGLSDAGWTQRNILVWNKSVFGMGYHFRNQAEYIIYVTKGKPKKYATKTGNVFNYKPPGLGPTSKPYEIWRDIITAIAVSDDVIADPFAGTNPLGKAIDNNPNFGNIISTAYINIFEQSKG